MPVERRRSDDAHLERINNYIEESKEFRGELKATLKHQTEKLEELNEKVRIQNGRVYKLEKFHWVTIGVCSLFMVLIRMVFK